MSADVTLANLEGRAVLLLGGTTAVDDVAAAGARAVDLEGASQGALPSDPMQALARLREVLDFADARGADALAAHAAAFDPRALGPPVPRPPKVFAIGLNYRAHAEEAGLELPKQPLVFTKFPNCLAGPRADIPLGSPRVDYEVELVAVVGERLRNVPVDRALEAVAGYTVGQDVSDRRLQFAGRPPQFALGKSLDGYGPTGPALVPARAVPDPQCLAIRCDVSGERRQDDTTAGMIFSVAELVHYLARFCTLEPGDLLFTGTPAGVGSVREPRRYLAPGDVVESAIEGIGRLRNCCVAAAGAD